MRTSEDDFPQERFKTSAHKGAKALMGVDFSCGEKTRFGSKKRANRFLNARSLDRMHAYFCENCRAYHVGHK